MATKETPEKPAEKPAESKAPSREIIQKAELLLSIAPELTRTVTDGNIFISGQLTHQTEERPVAKSDNLPPMRSAEEIAEATHALHMRRPAHEARTIPEDAPHQAKHGRPEVIGPTFGK